MSREQIVAVMYHELRHIDTDGKLIDHDIEDWFNMVATLGTDWNTTKTNISDLKFNRDIAEYKYKAGRDKAQALQAEISALQTLYKRQEDI